MVESFEELKKYFVPAQKTKAKISFGHDAHIVGFDVAKVVVFGVPYDGTATFGKGSIYGPYAIRHTSQRQIETFVVPQNIDVYEKTPIVDIGDFKVKDVSKEHQKVLQDESQHVNEKKDVLLELQKNLKQFEKLTKITRFLRNKKKIPLMIGGEHTLSYYQLLGLVKENPFIIHFDAHRDLKKEYLGMEVCHTTPFYHLLKEHKLDMVQIGIRQSDKDEEEYTNEFGIKTFFPKDIKHNFKMLKEYLFEKTQGRNVYISFDIDALDICYTPCTGTPEPFGLTPSEVVDLFSSIHPSATLIGLDMVEVSFKNDDFREGTIATQLLLRLFSQEFVQN